MTFSQKVAYSRPDANIGILGYEHFTSEYEHIYTNAIYTISLLRSEEYSTKTQKHFRIYSPPLNMAQRGDTVS